MGQVARLHCGSIAAVRVVQLDVQQRSMGNGMAAVLQATMPRCCNIFWAQHTSVAAAAATEVPPAGLALVGNASAD